MRGRSDVAAWLKQQLGLGRRRFRQPPGGFDDVEDCVDAACIQPLKLPRAPRHHRVSANISLENVRTCGLLCSHGHATTFEQ